MLHFVSLTFFMQHLFGFLVFQEMTQLPVCFGGPQQHFRPLYSLDLAECSILPWDHAEVWDGMCPAVCTHREGDHGNLLYRLQEKEEKDTIFLKQTIHVPDLNSVVFGFALSAFLPLFSNKSVERGSFLMGAQ